jgi:regulator of nucleoside diphosphate kinase
MLHTSKQIKSPGIWESLRTRFFSRHDQQPPRIFSEIDYYRLQGLLTRQHLEAFSKLAQPLRELRQLLNCGVLYPCKAIPGNLVTMSSVVLLRSRRGTIFRVGLVYPKDANRNERKVSILSRLGLALIGRIEGESVSSNMVIEKIVYQPESLGNYYAL